MFTYTAVNRTLLLTDIHCHHCHLWQLTAM